MSQAATALIASAFNEAIPFEEVQAFVGVFISHHQILEICMRAILTDFGFGSFHNVGINFHPFSSMFHVPNFNATGTRTMRSKVDKPGAAWFCSGAPI
jgi:hypothetical protein